MMNPVRVATGWLAGRLLVFLTVLAALVAMDVYREESTLLGVMLKGLVPDKELVQRLEDRSRTDRSIRERFGNAGQSTPGGGAVRRIRQDRCLDRSAAGRHQGEGGQATVVDEKSRLR